MGRILHETIKRIGSLICVRIRRGPLAGTKWILTTGRNFIEGHYEPSKTETLMNIIDSGNIVFDVGAHVGYFTLLMARKVGNCGHVYAFEPRPINLAFLKKHLRINAVTNVSVCGCCVGDAARSVSFNTHTGTGTGHVSDSGDLATTMIAIDDEVGCGRLPTPDVIKIDVEGLEVLVIKGALDTLATRQPKLILAVHSAQLEEECRSLLEPLGYQFSEIEQRKGDREFYVSVAANPA